MKGGILAIGAVVGLLLALEAFDTRARLVAAVRADARDAQAAVPAAPAPKPAGKPEAAPVLSETDRLKVQNAALAVENWSLKVQAAVGEMQKARAEFDRLVQSVTPAGWVLNDKLEFVKPEKAGGGG